jgi:hypothetical protein
MLSYIICRSANALRKRWNPTDHELENPITPGERSQEISEIKSEGPAVFDPLSWDHLGWRSILAAAQFSISMVLIFFFMFWMQDSLPHFYILAKGASEQAVLTQHQIHILPSRRHTIKIHELAYSYSVGGIAFHSHSKVTEDFPQRPIGSLLAIHYLPRSPGWATLDDDGGAALYDCFWLTGAGLFGYLLLFVHLLMKKITILSDYIHQRFGQHPLARNQTVEDRERINESNRRIMKKIWIISAVLFLAFVIFVFITKDYLTWIPPSEITAYRVRKHSKAYKNLLEMDRTNAR